MSFALLGFCVSSANAGDAPLILLRRRDWSCSSRSRLTTYSHIIRRIGALQAEAVGIICHRGCPIREDGLDAHLLREHVQHLEELAVGVRRIVDAGVVVVTVGFDACDRTRALERPRDDVEAGGFGGDGVGGWDDGLVVGAGFGEEVVDWGGDDVLRGELEG